jgi:hypothetical protein
VRNIRLPKAAPASSRLGLLVVALAVSLLFLCSGSVQSPSRIRGRESFVEMCCVYSSDLAVGPDTWIQGASWRRGDEMCNSDRAECVHCYVREMISGRLGKEWFKGKQRFWNLTS